MGGRAAQSGAAYSAEHNRCRAAAQCVYAVRIAGSSELGLVPGCCFNNKGVARSQRQLLRGPMMNRALFFDTGIAAFWVGLHFDVAPPVRVRAGTSGVVSSTCPSTSLNFALVFKSRGHNKWSSGEGATTSVCRLRRPLLSRKTY